MFQSTHPCGVRLASSAAPIANTVFQSTHPCGVRLCTPHLGSIFLCFNPRTRVGCDDSDNQPNGAKRFQSTHPCGVRPDRADAVILAMMFQSTHPCGVRPCQWSWLRVSAFQSTHPCGVRLDWMFWVNFTDSFNPRTRVGCDS